MAIWTPECADSWTGVFGGPLLTPGSLILLLPALWSRFLYHPSPFWVKPRGNHWTLAQTGQARAQSKQPAKIQSTARANKRTKTLWQHVQHPIYQDIDTHTDQQSSWRATLERYTVSCVPGFRHALHAQTHTRTAPLCACFVASLLLLSYNSLCSQTPQAGARNVNTFCT